MSTMANDFFSVGMHNVMQEVITSFEQWDAKEFENSWMKTWGYNFREGKSIEKESVERLEEMRRKVLSYDPLLLIVSERCVTSTVVASTTVKPLSSAFFFSTAVIHVAGSW